LDNDREKTYRFVTLWPSGTGAADGRIFVDANAGGTAFVRLVLSIGLKRGGTSEGRGSRRRLCKRQLWRMGQGARKRAFSETEGGGLAREREETASVDAE
jgi:hypothetical protein